MSRPAPAAARPVPLADWVLALAVWAAGSLAWGLMLQTVLESDWLATAFVSRPVWVHLIVLLGGTISGGAPQPTTAILPGAVVYGGTLLAALLAWIVGAALLGWRGPLPADRTAIDWALRGWRWGGLAATWWGGWIAALLSGATGLATLLAAAAPLWLALMVNLWVAEWFALRRRSGPAESGPPVDPAREVRRGWWCVAGCIAVYTVVYTAMNWGLYFNLQLPHGDSGMYEEHLWNLEHGKGFRSYLDQGLFLGEHLQVIHLLLLPLHWLWPSQLLLEFANSLALALTAAPMYAIALRHGRSVRAAVYLAAAVLLYFPLQQLDITIDFKTFRPSSFGVPLLLAMIDQLERRRWGWMTCFALLTLATEEVFAIPLALLGLWLAITGETGVAQSGDGPEVRRFARILGMVLCLGSGLYLWLAVKVVIPWFRGGEVVHYAAYFQQFGATPTEILRNMLLRPDLLLVELQRAPTVLYGLYLLAPLGFLPVLSLGRLLAGVPLYLLLCLNTVAQHPPGPFHHFHAPLLPLLFWAAAAGLERLAGRAAGHAMPGNEQFAAPICSAVRWSYAVCGARFALGCALLTGVCYSLHPLGIRFWDPGRIVAGRPTYWRALYLPDERARAWERVAPLIPPTAHVASTDFVHTRLTHCERSYDYSRYVRRVAGYEDRVPDDTNYIVIDLQHAYSRDVLGDVHSAADVRELREHPEEWELLTDPHDRYFVVLRRRTRA